ncbi:MAG: hypothetical protein GWP91_07240 [Rhodobacterales bacterium]|nr:hypothetical protein [Rhodobacterales bacterium]
MPHEQAISVLIEESDPSRRAAAHLLLGRRAMARKDRLAARRHFQEATTLEPSNFAARSELMRLDGVSAHNTPRTFFRWLLHRSAQA